MTRNERLVVTAVALAYIVVVGIGVAVHEPWWDEAQAWLLARDAPLSDLLAERLAYEGHPPLWYLILAVPAKLGLPFKTINVVSALIGTAGVLILLSLRSVPLALRAALPFTFFAAYQYTVVSRSYVLVPPLLFALAAMYERRDRHLVRFAVVLALLAQVSVHGACLAAAFVLLFFIDLWRGRLQASRISFRALAAAALILTASFVALVVVLWPRADLVTGSLIDLSFSAEKMLRVALTIITENTIGPTAVAVALAAVLLVWLFTRGVALELLVLSASMLPISSMYFARWHEGLFFWVFVFVLLIPGRHRRLPALIGWCVVAVIVAVHCVWTAASLSFDARFNFTASRDAARFIAINRIDNARLFGAGVRCLELQPYFAHNIFANYRAPGGGAFWDWSRNNAWPFPAPQPDVPRMSDWLSRQLAARPDFIVASARFRADAFYADALRRRPDYREIARFEGGLFWKDRVIEASDFAVFQRVLR